jgi:hypothetical protein
MEDRGTMSADRNALKAGTRWRSVVDSTEMIVVRPPSEPVELACGGSPVVPLDADTGEVGGTLDPAHAGGTLMGKRYVDEGSDIEILCTKPGPGSLSVDGRPLSIKDAKPLPSSD